jgi:hypothetical protein
MCWSRRKITPGPNVILQYRFDAQTGRLSPNTPQRVEQGDLVGPRHYIRHPSLDVVYFSNEQGCSVTPSMSLVAKQSGQPLLNHRQSPHYARDDDRERITSARQAAEALFTPKPQPVEPSASDPAPSAERPARKPRVLSILSPAVAKPRHNRRSSWPYRPGLWFTEGFGTADLQEAKALLSELAWAGVWLLTGRPNHPLAMPWRSVQDRVSSGSIAAPRTAGFGA